MNPRYERILQFLAVGICAPTLVITVLGIVVLLLTGNGVAGHDIVSYWSAARLLVQHGNPYDPVAILNLEKSVGFPPHTDVLMVRNPPLILPLILPLGYVTLRLASLLWSLVSLLCLAASARMLWIMQRRPNDLRQWVAYLLAPALLCVLAGQTALLSLLGVVLFFKLVESRPALAGASLCLCALKPHLFIPFAVIVVLWIVVTRSWAVLVGFIAALLLVSAASFAVAPHAWQQYRTMMVNAHLATEYMPCIAVALRMAIHPQRLWIQYLPAVMAVIWAATFFVRTRDQWSWLADGSLLLAVSVACAPYAWLTDQSLAVPLAFSAIYLRRSLPIAFAFALASCAIEIQFLRSTSLHSSAYLWTAPTFVAIAIAARSFGRKRSCPEDVSLTLSPEPERPVSVRETSVVASTR